MPERQYTKAEMVRFASLYEKICDSNTTLSLFTDKDLTKMAAKSGLEAIDMYECNFPKYLRSKMPLSLEEVSKLKKKCQDRLEKSP